MYAYNVYLATAVPVNCISCEAVQKDGGQLLYKMYHMYKPISCNSNTKTCYKANLTTKHLSFVFAKLNNEK